MLVQPIYHIQNTVVLKLSGISMALTLKTELDPLQAQTKSPTPLNNLNIAQKLRSYDNQAPTKKAKPTHLNASSAFLSHSKHS